MVVCANNPRVSLILCVMRDVTVVLVESPRPSAEITIGGLQLYHAGTQTEWIDEIFQFHLKDPNSDSMCVFTLSLSEVIRYDPQILWMMEIKHQMPKQRGRIASRGCQNPLIQPPGPGPRFSTHGSIRSTE